MIEYIIKFAGVIGGIIGLFAIPFQYVSYGMDYPNLMWFITIPFMSLSFAIIGSGMALVICIIVGGIAELFDDNINWPHQ